MKFFISPDDLESLSTRDRNFDEIYGVDTHVDTKYPMKLLRYLFMARFLDEECQRLEKPLRVCEIGVDRGQMLLFAKHYFKSKYGSMEISPYVAKWEAVSLNIQEDILRERGYDAWTEANVESSDFVLPHRYDVIILCHILEHLYDPEKVIAAIAPSLAPQGIVLGGMPVTPRFVAKRWESRIRKRALRFGHVSVFSPQRIRKMAVDAGLTCDVLSGAFFFRRTGSRLENIKSWAVANLAFGRRFPGWPGEIYWKISRNAAKWAAPVLVCAILDSL